MFVARHAQSCEQMPDIARRRYICRKCTIVAWQQLIACLHAVYVEIRKLPHTYGPVTRGLSLMQLHQDKVAQDTGDVFKCYTCMTLLSRAASYMAEGMTDIATLIALDSARNGVSEKIPSLYGQRAQQKQA